MLTKIRFATPRPADLPKRRLDTDNIAEHQPRRHKPGKTGKSCYFHTAKEILQKMTDVYLKKTVLGMDLI